jgi:cell division protease FtsH
MSEKIGPVSYAGEEESGIPGLSLLGEETRREIDGEIRRILGEAYAKAEGLIEAHRGDVESIARALLERETLDGDEVGRLLAQPAAGSAGG